MSEESNSKGSQGKSPVTTGDAGEGDSGFVVRDRRRFESDGRAREESKEGVVTGPGALSGAVKQTDGADRVPDANASGEASTTLSSGGGSQGFEEVSFSSFVMSLATQALMQLGVVAPPQGYDLPQDIHGAKHTIDLLQMLQDKTKGNLDAQEAALIEDILHNVRLAFVRRK